MKKRILLIILTIACLFVLNACSQDTTESEKSGYSVISQEKAKNMIDNQDVIILDVRTKEEYQSGHIKDALLIPVSEIEDKAPVMLPDKEKTILVYCRTGNRSAIAGKTLAVLGYKKVYDFKGITTWEYGIEK